MEKMYCVELTGLCGIGQIRGGRQYVGPSTRVALEELLRGEDFRHLNGSVWKKTERSFPRPIPGKSTLAKATWAEIQPLHDLESVALQ